MECPKCGYWMGPLDNDCPRCTRLAQKEAEAEERGGKREQLPAAALGPTLGSARCADDSLPTDSIRSPGGRPHQTDPGRTWVVQVALGLSLVLVSIIVVGLCQAPPPEPPVQSSPPVTQVPLAQSVPPLSGPASPTVRTTPGLTGPSSVQPAPQATFRRSGAGEGSAAQRTGRAELLATIRPGMTSSEVVALVGEPNRDQWNTATPNGIIVSVYWYYDVGDVSYQITFDRVNFDKREFEVGDVHVAQNFDSPAN